MSAPTVSVAWVAPSTYLDEPEAVDAWVELTSACGRFRAEGEVTLTRDPDGELIPSDTDPQGWASGGLQDLLAGEAGEGLAWVIVRAVRTYGKRGD